MEVWTTVEPVYNGPLLSGHTLLNGQFSKSLMSLMSGPSRNISSLGKTKLTVFLGIWH